MLSLKDLCKTWPVIRNFQLSLSRIPDLERLVGCSCKQEEATPFHDSNIPNVAGICVGMYKTSTWINIHPLLIVKSFIWILIREKTESEFLQKNDHIPHLLLVIAEVSRLPFYEPIHRIYLGFCVCKGHQGNHVFRCVCCGDEAKGEKHEEGSWRQCAC